MVDDEIGKYLQETAEKLNMMLNTHKIAFLTGGPGVGKSSIVHRLKKLLNTKITCCAPTHLAAENIGGKTIYSAFSLDYKKIKKDWKTAKKRHSDEADAIQEFITVTFKGFDFNRDKYFMKMSFNTVIVDEISMIPLEIFIVISTICYKYDIFLLVCGDFFQLPPVNEEHLFISNYWKAKITKDNTIYLNKNIRNENKEFNDFLRQMRTNTITPEFFKYIARHQYYPKKIAEHTYVHLVGSNKLRRKKNNEILKTIQGKEHKYVLNITKMNQADVFKADEYIKSLNDARVNRKGILIRDMDLSTIRSVIDNGVQNEQEEELMEELLETRKFDYTLKLKEGCRVIFNQNDDYELRRFYNGKRGIFLGEEDGALKVQLLDKDDNEGEIIYVERVSKEIKSYGICLEQYPLVLSYALTVHKSQGMSIDRIVCYLSSYFEYGQFYVAVSRSCNVDGLLIELDKFRHITEQEFDGDVNANSTWFKYMVTQDMITEPTFTECMKELIKGEASPKLECIHWSTLNSIKSSIKDKSKTLPELWKQFDTSRLKVYHQLIESNPIVVDYYMSMEMN